MDVGRAFTFAFEDPNWLKKLLIGGALLFIPVFGWLVVGGYWMRIIRGAYQGDDTPLPEWDQLGDDFVLGLKGAVALFVWWLPFLVVLLTFVCLSIPFWIAANTNNGAATALFAIPSLIGWTGVSLASVLFQVVMLAIQPLIIGRIAVSGELADGFRAREILREIRLAPIPLLIVVALEYGIRSVTGFGILICIVGLAFTTFAGFVLLSHLYGQLRRVIEEATPSRYGPFLPT